MSQRNQKIKLKKRSRQSARIHRGFAMPVGPGSENSLVSFRDLMFAQFMFSIILYSKIVESILINHMEYAIIFGIIFVLLSIPAIWSQISLGIRRCHDINKPGLMFAVPFICYLASYVLPVLGQDTAATAAQSIMAVSYLGLFTVKGTSGDNAYGPERAR